jgi:hypothetical protein
MIYFKKKLRTFYLLLIFDLRLTIFDLKKMVFKSFNE